MHTFLPKKDPLRTYKTNSRSLRKLENVASNLPKLLLTNKVQKTINSLNINSFSVNKIIKEESKEEINLAMSHLSFIAHSYIWGGNKPQSLLPQVIAEPWVKLSNFRWSDLGQKFTSGLSKINFPDLKCVKSTRR